LLLHKCPHPYHKAKKRQALEKNAVIIFAVSLVFLFALGRFTVKGAEEFEIANKAQAEEIAELKKLNQAMQKKQDFVDSEKIISQQVEKDARIAQAGLHDELSAATEQLTFYQRIIAPEKFNKGVYAHSLSISRKDELGMKFQLVIAQGSDTKKAIKGRVELQIEGAQGNRMKTLKYSEVSAQKVSSLRFSLRYYQVLSGDIMLPAGFVPKQVIVKTIPSSSKSKASVKRWLWSEVVTSS
jgi:phage tail sheath protein FI